MQGVLYGIRVLDFSTLLPGPLASLILCEAGAEVIKVERPDIGDEMRSFQPKWGGADSANFHLLNRGKTSLSLDLKDPAQRDRLWPLIAQTDVVIEQFRPGVMARLGLGHDDMVKVKPDIIYCSITGYGQTGPKRGAAAHDLIYQAETGLLALSHGTAPPPSLTADIAGGTYPALVNILMAMWRRENTGQGVALDIAMAENLFPMLYWAQGEGQVTGLWPGNGTSLVTGGSPRYRLYPTADGRFAAVAAIEPKFWEAFCKAIALEPAFADLSDPARTAERVAEILLSQSAAHWEAVFAAADCCCSIVKTLPEAIQSPQFQTRGVFAGQIQSPAGDQMPALPVPVVTAFRAKPRPIAPSLGQDNAIWLNAEGTP
jgi:alpha-methylacyl-CoA racemase